MSGLDTARGVTVLGFDVGSRRIGVAVGSSFSQAARALAVVEVHAGTPEWARIDRLRDEWLPQALIVGDPLTLDDGDQPARRRAQRFARQLRERYRVPVFLVDERSSSREAARRFAQDRAQGWRRRREGATLDADAAAIIVQRWMDAPEDAAQLP